MRRRDAIQLKVKSPSRGLVTRWPAEVADMLRGGAQAISEILGLASVSDQTRVCVVAQNVRFEDGVITNAPGYETVVFLGDGVATDDGSAGIGTDDGSAGIALDNSGSVG